MPAQTRPDKYRKIAEDFLRWAESAPTEEEREDFLDMARAIERVSVKAELNGQQQGRHRRS